MTANRRASLEEIRAFHAKMMAAASNSHDERLERIFELVPREAFLGPGPWQIKVNRRYIETPGADPSILYQNALVALDRTKGINNGEPFLHAAWIGVAAPKSGDTVIHIGAGTGYYTALLSMLVLPNGHVHAFEIEKDLANRARANLEPFEGISLVHGDATTLALPNADLIYVNAGVVAPPASWLKALRPGGRIIFPWQANKKAGLAVLITRTETGYAARPLMPSWFIPCVGASDVDQCSKSPSRDDAWSIRKVWLTEDRAPDESAAAIYRDLWFSKATDGEH
ncbi:protein-L-isoaspartate O-methyltransferase family protein [Rhizobium sp. LEGMi198b]|uniref:protein-L-isoaspartate O-methyltransferase family protein n=1 Tax=Rhizobium sp. CNPSo 3464 TaxID=3021406 RepID=UPI00254B10FC|nr:methyltransferase domain-containing protein [Rhizobium sp. CNPSo 3464]MDK4737874.1 methyltransferase domain-containing protein [Rhizobium sp. CNPSo 3464]